jgi:hypothetical protein
VAVVVENEPPVAAAPVASLVRGTRATQAGVPLRLSWAPATDQSPIARYEVGEVGAAGADGTAEPTVVASTAGTIRTATRTIPFATPRAWAVRATDRPGNVGSWAAAAPSRVFVVQESSSVVRRSTGWTGYLSTNALGGRATYATRAGSTVRYTFTAPGVALVGPKGPTRGSAEIRLDGVLVGTVSAWSSTSGSRWLLLARAVDPARSHTLEVRVLGTAGHPRFDVDAFLVLR